MEQLEQLLSEINDTLDYIKCVDDYHEGQIMVYQTIKERIEEMIKESLKK